MLHRGARPQGSAQLETVTDELQRTVLIRVIRSGADLVSQVTQIMACHEAEPCWTYQITLQADRGYAIAEYEQLRKIGFFFTGLKAACAQIEQLLMQWCGELELHMEDYILTGEFEAIRQRIKQFYEGREHV